MAAELDPVRIAFIAVRSTGTPPKDPVESFPQDALEAVVIGTNDAAGTDWRYACYPLNDLIDILGDAGGQKYGTPFSPRGGKQDIVRYHDGIGNDPKPRYSSPHDDFDPPEAGDIVLDNVLLCAAYRAPYASTAKAQDIKAIFDEGPLARFDTIGFAVMADGSPPPLNWLVSRVLVKPAGAGDRGHLKGFRLELQIRVALNGHAFENALDLRRNDRFDTRIILSLKAVQRTTTQSMWRKPVGSEPRGALCEMIECNLTIRPWASAEQVARSLTPLRFPNADLIDATAVQGGESTHIDVVPLLADLKIPPPDGPPYVYREFGLRVVRYDLSTSAAQRVALRLELKLDKHAAKVGPLLAGLIPDFARLPSDGAVGFAQEQRVADIGNVALAPSTGTYWILTAWFRPPQLDKDEITRFIADAYNDPVDNEHKALRQVRDGGPLSVLPLLTATVNAPRTYWHAVSLLKEAKPWQRLMRLDSVANDDATTAGRTFKLLTFEPRAITDMWKGLDAYKRTDGGLRFVSRANASFVRFVATAGTQPACTVRLTAPTVFATTSTNVADCTLGPAWQPAITMSDDMVRRAKVRFAIAIEKTDGSDVVLGALGFSLPNVVDAADVSLFDLVGLISFWPRGPVAGRPYLLRTEIEALIKFPVERATPVGEDDLPPEVQKQLLGPGPNEDADPDDPLIFDLEEAVKDPALRSDEKIIQTIAAFENLERGRDQSVQLSLRATVKSRAKVAPRRLALVIDPVPFRVAAVEYLEPARSASDQGNEVAVWNAGGEEGLSWRILDRAEAVRMVLPPQVIGEAMEKFADSIAGVPKDIEPGKPAAARFGAATRLEIDPTYFASSFREPGWNLRRIMGYPNMRSPGSRLRDLRLELLYGMTVRISVRDASQDAFITEMSGAVGAPVLPTDDVAGGDQPTLMRHLRLAERVLTAQRRRLAVDKLWSGRPDAELKVEDSVSFHLRSGSEDAKQRGPATKLRWPIGGDVPDDPGGLIDKTTLEKTFSTLQDDADSFPGGAAWAFESANILMKVYGRPDSDGGWVKGIHLSAHGGYGGQRALFDEKKTIIETETTQGRTHRYKLERIGRIGCLWNRSKHVIIYERTVVPSAQFYNKPPIGKLQDEHVGRPILRKVEEYVELLQPIRRFPEDGTSISAAGFLVGCEFKSRRIRVDSRWGGDVRREGWQVPLWNKAFTQLTPLNQSHGSSSDPDDPALIYPKPQIRMLLAGEGGSEISVEVDEPEKLVFYTSVVDGESGDNTDLWRAVRDIDFVDLTPPEAGKLSPRSEYLTDATLPPEPPHAPGFERLTVGLVPAKEVAVLTHGRSPTGLGAVLKNVTLARATPVSGGGAGPVRALGQTLAQGSADLRATIDAKVGEALGVLEKLDPASSKTQIKDAVKVAFAQASFKDDIRRVTDNLAGELSRLNSAGLGQLPTKPCATLATRLTDVVEGQIQRLRAIADNAVDSAFATALAPVNVVAGMTRDTLAMLLDEGSLSRDVRAELIDDLNALQNRIATIADEVKADIDLLPTRVAAALDAIIAVTGMTVGSAQDSALSAGLAAIDTAFATLVSTIGNATVVDTTIEGAAVTTLTSLQEAAKGIDRISAEIGDPSALSAARRLFPAIWPLVNSAIDYVATLKVGQAIDPVQLHKLADDLHELKTHLANRIGTGSPALQALGTELNRFIATAQDFANRIVVEVENAIDAGLDEANSLFDRVSDLIYALADIQDPLNPQDAEGGLVDALRAVGDRVDQLEAALTEPLKRVRTELHSAADQLAAAVAEKAKAVVGSFVQSCEAFDNFIADAIGQAGDIAKWLHDSLGLDEYASRLNTEIAKAVDEASGALEELKRAAAEKAAEITRAVEGRARQIAGGVQETVRDALGTDPVLLADQANRIYQKGSDTLRVLRAVGDPPKTDRLGFNRPEVAYVLSEANKIVDMTPAIALVNRVSDTIAAGEKAGKAVGDLLQSFGVRLPGSGVAEQFVADKLKSLSVPDLIPNMGGIDFRGLLKRFAFPDLDDSKAIKVRHGFDHVQMRAWLESEIDVPFTEPAPLLSFGPVEIIVDDARFNAKAVLSAGRDGTRKTMNGFIAGDWRVAAAGQTILTFRRTGLFFDDSGQLDFRIDPERVELADALEFLTNFLAASGKGDGLVIEPLMRGAIPSGIAARMDVALPDIQLGVFGISNLSLHILFGVAAIPEFELLCELSVGKKTLPFTLSVWILNGGGFLTQRLSFRPIAKPKPVLIYSLEVGIVAGVGLGFNFGVVSGGVWLQVGCSITMVWSTGPGGNTTALSVFILARGNVDVAGLITAAISLLLEVTYDGSLMVGSGTLSLSFKISMFYTLRVSQHVEYVFAGSKQDRGSYSESYA